MVNKNDRKMYCIRTEIRSGSSTNNDLNNHVLLIADASNWLKNLDDGIFTLHKR